MRALAAITLATCYYYWMAFVSAGTGGGWVWTAAAKIWDRARLSLWGREIRM